MLWEDMEEATALRPPATATLPRRHQLLRPDHRRPPAASCRPPGERGQPPELLVLQQPCWRWRPSHQQCGLQLLDKILLPRPRGLLWPELKKIVLKTPTRQALENRGRGGENFGTRRLGVAVIQHLL